VALKHGGPWLGPGEPICSTVIPFGFAAELTPAPSGSVSPSLTVGPSHG
jgi:hypothetical protein